MSNQEILTKALEKALEKGWVPLHQGKKVNPESATVSHIITQDPRLFVYSHDFAKALWGDSTGSPYWPDMKCLVCKDVHGMPDEQGEDFLMGEPWRYHLQQMVLTEDPIKYLGDNL